MNISRLLTSVVGLALMATPAVARSVPALAGNYATNYNQTCQAVQSTADPGSTYQAVFLSTFDSVAGTVHEEGSAVSGGLVVWTGGVSGMTISTISKDSSYSNTGNTVTFDGVIYSVFYGPVKKGIARSLVLIGIPAAGCAVSIILIGQ